MPATASSASVDRFADEPAADLPSRSRGGALPARSLLHVAAIGEVDARVDFTNGGYVEAKDFLLDIEGDNVEPERLAEMIVSAMNLLRAGPVTITRMQVVQRGEHQDAVPAAEPRKPL